MRSRGPANRPAGRMHPPPVQPPAHSHPVLRGRLAGAPAGRDAASGYGSSGGVLGMGAESPVELRGIAFLGRGQMAARSTGQAVGLYGCRRSRRFRQNDGSVHLDGVLIRRNRRVSAKRSLLEIRANERSRAIHFDGGPGDSTPTSIRSPPSTACCGLFASYPRRFIRSTSLFWYVGYQCCSGCQEDSVASR